MQRNVDFTAQGQCFVDVALIASIWALCVLLGALAASIWLPCALLGVLAASIWLPCVLLGALGASIWLPCVLLGALAGSIWLSCALLGALAGSIRVPSSLLDALAASIWVQTIAPTTRLTKKNDLLIDDLPRCCIPRALWIVSSCLKSSVYIYIRRTYETEAGLTVHTHRVELVHLT